MTAPYSNPGYQPAAPPMPAPKVKQRRRWPWVIGIVLAFGLGAAVGSAGKSTPTTAAGSSSSVSVAPAKTAPVVAAPTTAPAAPAGPKTAFGDGTFKVGEDIEAGTYKTIGPRADAVVKNCYWARMKDDSGAVTSIIANNNTSGPTRLTVKKGEYLEVSGCDFTKA